MKDPKAVDVREMLLQTLMINVQDARQCLRIATEHGDADLQKRAEQDLKRWEERLSRLQTETK